MDGAIQKQLVSESWAFQFLVSRRFRIFRHLLLLIFLSMVLYYSTPEIGEPTLVLLFFLVLFYINMYVLVPFFLFKNKLFLYGLSILAIIAISAFGGYLLESSNTDDGLNIPLFSLLIVILMAASSSVKLLQKGMKDKLVIDELEKSKTETELQQLKNQINPHFLFNMLNNANVLTKKDPEKASQVLMKLSDLLRYQLYDSTRASVLLTSDIHFLEDFLNLEKIRRDQFDFIISKEGVLSGILVPPLLFISFVENAVKHNNDGLQKSYVHLFFEVHNNILNFKCINSKPQMKASNTPGGLGLANIKRRLQLLYPSLHRLEIADTSDTFSIDLSLTMT